VKFCAEIFCKHSYKFSVDSVMLIKSMETMSDKLYVMGMCTVGNCTDECIVHDSTMPLNLIMSTRQSKRVARIWIYSVHFVKTVVK
jgi:hypothetical protein